MKRNRHLLAANIWLVIALVAISLCDSVGWFGILAVVIAFISFLMFALNADRYKRRLIRH